MTPKFCAVCGEEITFERMGVKMNNGQHVHGTCIPPYHPKWDDKPVQSGRERMVC
jgi:hypothetical protein